MKADERFFNCETREKHEKEHDQQNFVFFACFAVNFYTFRLY